MTKGTKTSIMMTIIRNSLKNNFIMKRFILIFSTILLLFVVFSVYKTTFSGTIEKNLPLAYSSQKLTTDSVGVNGITSSVKKSFYFSNPVPECEIGLYSEIIELDYTDGRLIDGYMWGGTDHFDDMREDGYYQGYFVAQLKDLRVSNDSIYFCVDTRGTQYFSSPICISIHSWQEAKDMGGHQWLHIDRFQDSIAFKGIMKGDMIFFDKRNCKSKNLPWVDFTFHKISLDSLKRIDRSIPSEIECQNRYSTWYE